MEHVNGPEPLDVAGPGQCRLRLHSVPRLLKPFGIAPEELPLSVLLLLEIQLRSRSGEMQAGSAPELVRERYGKGQRVMAEFMPARVIMQDASGVPVLADLADLEERVAATGASLPARPAADLVVDHSGEPWHVDGGDAAERNLDEEYRRNAERYSFLRWAEHLFKDIRIHPPGSGIIHQVNLETLSAPIQQMGDVCFPDSCFGTDSHTTMINALGTLGWGGGGVEAVGLLAGEALSFELPEIIGLELSGSPGSDIAATDIALTLAAFLRKAGVSGAILEAAGNGVEQLDIQARATLANMAPEYGAMMLLFPIDDQTLGYWSERDPHLASIAAAYYRAQRMWGARRLPGRYGRVLRFDLGKVTRSLAGPSLPHQTIAVRDFRGYPDQPGDRLAVRRDERQTLRDGDVVLAAITSCTNTANLDALAQAALTARKARLLGLRCAPHVKTVFAPGSQASVETLHQLGLLDDLIEMGFRPSLYGCGPCVGNVGGLPREALQQLDGVRDVVAVISGNRNFSGRIHARVRSNFLASPALVVACAIRGTMRGSLQDEPIGIGGDGLPRFLHDVLPGQDEIRQLKARILDAGRGRGRSPPQPFAQHAAARWAALPVPSGPWEVWKVDSLFFQRPPFAGETLAENVLVDIRAAVPLLVLGDSVTTDHISPVGAIGAGTAAGRYLEERGLAESEFGTFSGRRVNHHVMVRGTFGSPRLRNHLVTGEGPFTRDVRTGEIGTVFEVAQMHQAAGIPSVVIAGSAYGSGSARDWAAKGTRLLGIRAVIARDFERIHRANLVALGVLPLVCEDVAFFEALAQAIALDVVGLADVTLRDRAVYANILRPMRTTGRLHLDVRTEREVAYLSAGGLLPYLVDRARTKSFTP